jgi:hypothetical protein
MSIPSINADTPNQVKRHNLDQFEKREANKKASGKLTQKEQIVLVIFESGGRVTRNEVAELMKSRWPHRYRNPPTSSVCARLNEMAGDLVETVGTMDCPITKRSAHAVKCTNKGVQLANQAKFKDARLSGMALAS